MEQPLVSIVIPARNEEKTIQRCIDSLTNSDYPMNRLEIIVVDGMSEDRTGEIVKMLSAETVRSGSPREKITPLQETLESKQRKAIT